MCFCVCVGDFGCLRIWTGGCFAFWFGCFSAYEYLISWQLVFGCCNVWFGFGIVICAWLVYLCLGVCWWYLCVTVFRCAVVFLFDVGLTWF